MRERDRTHADASARSVALRLYDTEFAHLTRYAESITGDRLAAEDLVQEAFIVLLDNPPDDSERTGAWLRVVVRRLCLDTLRRRKSGLGKEQAAQRAHVEVWQPSAESETLRADEIERVRKSLAQLCERDRTALFMRHSGYSYREIGAALGVETGAVGVLLLRAMKRWRQDFIARDGDAPAQAAPSKLQLDASGVRRG